MNYRQTVEEAAREHFLANPQHGRLYDWGVTINNKFIPYENLGYNTGITIAQPSGFYDKRENASGSVFDIRKPVTVCEWLRENPPLIWDSPATAVSVNDKEVKFIDGDNCLYYVPIDMAMYASVLPLKIVFGDTDIAYLRPFARSNEEIEHKVNIESDMPLEDWLNSKKVIFRGRDDDNKNVIEDVVIEFSSNGRWIEGGDTKESIFCACTGAYMYEDFGHHIGID